MGDLKILAIVGAISKGHKMLSSEQIAEAPGVCAGVNKLYIYVLNIWAKQVIHVSAIS